VRLALVLTLFAACEEQQPARVAPRPTIPSRALCQQLFEHIVDLELAKSGLTDSDRQRAAIIDAKSPEFMTACTTKTPLRVVECGVAAKDLDTLAACDR